VPYFLPDSASLDRTGDVGRAAAESIRKHPAVANISQVDGYSLIDSQNKTNFGVLFVSLKDYEQRKGPGLTADDVIAAARRDTAPIQGGLVVPVNPPAIRAWASPPASRCGSSRREAAPTDSWPKWWRSSPRRASGRNWRA